MRLLGAVSLFTDISSEMLYPVVPLFLTSVLGAPMAVVGLVEGLAESTASLLKTVSGRLSDRAGVRRPFVTGGYALSSVAKPLFALATGWPTVLLARLVDRTGKGIRGPARDAIIAATTPPASRGRAFGLHKAMDTTGAVLGPAIGAIALGPLALGYRTLFLLAFLPALVGVLLTLRVREPVATAPRPARGTAALGALSPELRRFLLVVGIFSLGNSSNVFLLLRARELGYSETGVLLLYLLYNLVYASAALPLGILADRVGRRHVILIGMAVFAIAYAAMALAQAAWQVPVILALYGIYSSTTGSAMRAFVADTAGDLGAATAQGLYQTVTGILLLASSLLAGALWDLGGPILAFGVGAACATVATVVFALVVPEPARA